MAVAASYPVRSPQWMLTYSGVNISGDISPMVLGITYDDRLSAASGAVEIEIEDRAKRWQGPWYPALGDRFNLMLGYHGEALLPCGDFQVDELELDGPPDVFRLRGLATYVTPAMRTMNTAGYEGQSLSAIAGTIAGKYGLGLVTASGVEDLAFGRITQRRETDLEFLKRLANEHGYDFSVRGTTLVFYAIAALELAPPLLTMTRSGIERFRFRNRTRRIYDSAAVAYQDPDTKSLIFQSVPAEPATAAGDTFKLVTRCENGAQATVKAASALHYRNLRFIEASLTMPGNVALAAGVNVTVSGWGALDSTYLIERATHHLARASGYTTAIEARRVG
jgi:Bacteriophage probable baseplate hub protein